VKGVVIRLNTLHRLYRSTRLEDILSGICWSETADRHSCLVSDPRLGRRGNFASHPVRRYTARNYFRDTIDWPSTRTVRMSDVFQRDHILGIQRYISTVAALRKQILRNQNHAHISVMDASRKQFAHLLGIDVVQHIV